MLYFQHDCFNNVFQIGNELEVTNLKYKNRH